MSSNYFLSSYIDELCRVCHKRNETWWHNPETGEPISRNVGELLMLCVSELAEAMEGYRKGLMDSHLPDRMSIEVELADALIRIFDLAGGYGFKLGGAFVEKLEYNAHRADHKPEERLKANGKRF